MAHGIHGSAWNTAAITCGGWYLDVVCQEEVNSPVILWFIFCAGLLSFKQVLQRNDANGCYLLLKREYNLAPDTQNINLKR